MSNELCELRFDVPLPRSGGPCRFEQEWRALLAAQRLTALTMPPAETITARFRICGTQPESLTHYMQVRLAALPGSPCVAIDAIEGYGSAGDTASEWQGVRVWLSYRATDLTRLLQNSKQKLRQKHSRFSYSHKKSA